MERCGEYGGSISNNLCREDAVAVGRMGTTSEQTSYVPTIPKGEIEMFKLLVLLAILTSAATAQTNAPPLPIGLWQAKDDGFVVRVEACNGGFCGVAAGAPSGGEQKDNCGKLIFINFVWNQSSGRWDGQMHPPNKDLTLKSQIDTDSETFLTLHAHAGFISKSVSFKPYSGKIGASCRLEP
jgi:uncharacterized protein (DUF2147 family)